MKQFSKFCLRQQLFAFKEFCMETRLSNIFKTTNATNFNKAILKTSYRVVQVTFKQKTLKQPAYLLKAVQLCFTFWKSNWHNFGYISGKVAKPHFLESPQKSKLAFEHTIFWFLPFPFFQILNNYWQKSYNRFRVLASTTT